MTSPRSFLLAITIALAFNWADAEMQVRDNCPGTKLFKLAEFPVLMPPFPSPICPTGDNKARGRKFIVDQSFDVDVGTIREFLDEYKRTLSDKGWDHLVEQQTASNHRTNILFKASHPQGIGLRITFDDGFGRIRGIGGKTPLGTAVGFEMKVVVFAIR